MKLLLFILLLEILKLESNVWIILSKLILLKLFILLTLVILFEKCFSFEFEDILKFEKIKSLIFWLMLLFILLKLLFMMLLLYVLFLVKRNWFKLFFPLKLLILLILIKEGNELSVLIIFILLKFELLFISEKFWVWKISTVLNSELFTVLLKLKLLTPFTSILLLLLFFFVELKFVEFWFFIYSSFSFLLCLDKCFLNDFLPFSLFSLLIIISFFRLSNFDFTSLLFCESDLSNFIPFSL